MQKRIINLILSESLGIVFTKEEEELYGITEGDIVDLSDMLIQRNDTNTKRGLKNGKTKE